LLQIRLSEALTKIFYFLATTCLLSSTLSNVSNGAALISTAHLPPAIKPAVMASEETIPIIVEFTYGPNRIPEAPWGNMG
jgi:hypothetical protein